MRQATALLTFDTPGRGLSDITRQIGGWVVATRMTEGLLTVFCRHTSCSLLIQENAAPEVRDDIIAFFDRIAPEGRGLYAHDDEGPDDMPAHLRAALTQTHLSIPVIGGVPSLGTWQAIYLFEHRRAPHRRGIALHMAGE